jgi:hypothetical protein
LRSCLGSLLLLLLLLLLHNLPLRLARALLLLQSPPLRLGLQPPAGWAVHRSRGVHFFPSRPKDGDVV